MNKIQKKFLYILSVFLLLFLINSCSKKNEDEGKSPITTSSKEAMDEYLKGRDLSERLQGNESLKYFTDAIKLDSNFALAYLGRSGVQISAKGFFDDLNKAVSLAGKVSEPERLQIMGFEAGVNADPAKQKEYYDKLISLVPNDQRAFNLLGVYYFGQRDYQNAVNQLNKAVSIDSNFAPAYNMLGYSYKQLMNYDAAEEAFKDYISLIPDDPNPYDSYAELLMKEGKYDQSIENYKKALTYNPHFVSSIVGIAANEMYKGDYNEARAQMQNLFDNARNDAERRTALLINAISYVEEGKPDMALTELNKSYQIAEKNNDYGLLSGDLFNMGTVLLETGKYKEALQDFQKSVDMFNKTSSAQELKDNVKLGLLFNEGNVALEQKDFKMANSKADEFMKGVKAINNSNQIELAHQLYGMIALAQKNADSSLTEFSKANSEDPYNLYRIALAYQLKGDKDSAKEFCSKALNFNPLPTLNSAFARNKAKKMLPML